MSKMCRFRVHGDGVRHLSLWQPAPLFIDLLVLHWFMGTIPPPWEDWHHRWIKPWSREASGHDPPSTFVILQLYFCAIHFINFHNSMNFFEALIVTIPNQTLRINPGNIFCFDFIDYYKKFLRLHFFLMVLARSSLLSGYSSYPH